MSVHEATKKAVEQSRDYFEEYDSYDDVLRDAMKQFDKQNEHLSPEVRRALNEGLMKVDDSTDDDGEEDA